MLVCSAADGDVFGGADVARAHESHAAVGGGYGHEHVKGATMTAAVDKTHHAGSESPELAGPAQESNEIISGGRGLMRLF